jgi:hypothetical protein
MSTQKPKRIAPNERYMASECPESGPYVQDTHAAPYVTAVSEHETLAEAEAEAAFKSWAEANIDRLQVAWDEHLSYLRDSLAHVAFLRSSDKCFEEFAREKFEVAPVRTDYSTLTGLWLVYNGNGIIISKFPFENQAYEFIRRGGAA